MTELVDARDLRGVMLSDINNGETRQIKFTFPNGFTLRVINDGYGSSDGMFEIAIFDQNGDWHTIPEMEGDTVLGYLTAADVRGIAWRVRSMQPRVMSKAR